MEKLVYLKSRLPVRLQNISLFCAEIVSYNLQVDKSCKNCQNFSLKTIFLEFQSKIFMTVNSKIFSNIQHYTT